MALRVLRLRVLGFLVTGLALIAATLLPASPAHAAYGAQLPVTVSVVDETGTRPLGTASGWVQFDTGRTTFRYQLTVSQQSSYPAPNVFVYANGSQVATHAAVTGVISGEVPNAAAVQFARVVIEGGTFYGSSYVRFRSDGGGANHGSSYGRVFNPYY